MPDNPKSQIQIDTEAWAMERAEKARAMGNGGKSQIQIGTEALARESMENILPPSAMLGDMDENEWMKEEEKELPPAYSLTDEGNGQRIARIWGIGIRYCFLWKKWMTWDVKRWIIDNNGTLMNVAKHVSESIAKEDEARAKELSKWSLTSKSVMRLQAALTLAQSEPGIPVQPEHFDLNPLFFNCGNGTIELDSGGWHAHVREDLMTKLSPVHYMPGQPCPTWLAFLDTVFQGNQELIHWLQKAVGYSLTGLTNEQCFFLCYGVGSNGKSTFLNILRAILGDYSEQASFETFLKHDRESVRNDLASLKSCRIVVASEVGEGQKLNEALIKTLTGGDPITARLLYSEFFTYTPQFKVWLAANHKPTISGTDHALWRRVRLIPFDVIIPDEQQDKNLSAKLLIELPGILSWATRGYLAMRKEGFAPPESVLFATQEYRKESDSFGSFLEECCHVDLEWSETSLRPQPRVSSTALFARYQEWSKAAGEKDSLSQTMVGKRLKARGFTQEKDQITRAMHWKGLNIIPFE